MSGATITEVIQLRATAAKLTLIDRAAQASGRNRNDFILDASCEKAWDIVADQTHFAIGPEAMRRFVELVDVPLENPESLRRLLGNSADWETIP